MQLCMLVSSLKLCKCNFKSVFSLCLSFAVPRNVDFATAPIMGQWA